MKCEDVGMASTRDGKLGWTTIVMVVTIADISRSRFITCMNHG